MQPHTKRPTLNINPNVKCKSCKSFLMEDDPSFYVDSFHFFCKKVNHINSYGDAEPTCIDGYYHCTNGDCDYYEESER